MEREAKTVEVMIRRYCINNHGRNRELCSECRELLLYARKRLQHCPFQEGKTSCGNCTVHCYKPEMRKKMCRIMRQVGPRMIFTNPIMGIRHIIDGLRKNPVKKN
jgi:hypothetical protein